MPTMKIIMQGKHIPAIAWSGLSKGFVIQSCKFLSSHSGTDRFLAPVHYPLLTSLRPQIK